MKQTVFTLLLMLGFATNLFSTTTNTPYEKALLLHKKGQYKKALAIFQQLAESNNPAAIYCVGFYNEKGLATDTNQTHAIECYTQIINTGNSEDAALYSDDIQAIAKAITPTNGTLKENAKDLTKILENDTRDLTAAELFLLAVWRESQDKSRKEWKTYINLYASAAAMNYKPAQYRMVKLHEQNIMDKKHPINLVQYYRWASEDFLKDYNVPTLPRIIMQHSTRNTMSICRDGMPHPRRLGVPELYEVEKGMKIGEFDIEQISTNEIELKGFFEYMTGYDNKPSTKIIIKRGQPTKLTMCGVTDMDMNVYITYLP